MIVMKEAGWKGQTFGFCLHLAIQCHNSRLLMKKICMASKYCFLTLRLTDPQTKTPGCWDIKLPDDNIVGLWVLVLQKAVLKNYEQHKLGCVPSSPLGTAAASLWGTSTVTPRTACPFLLRFIALHIPSQVCQCASFSNQSILQLRLYSGTVTTSICNCRPHETQAVSSQQHICCSVPVLTGSTLFMMLIKHVTIFGNEACIRNEETERALILAQMNCLSSPCLLRGLFRLVCT